MDMLLTLISGLVIICLLGAMLYATKAIKAQRAGRHEEKKNSLIMAGIFFAGYVAVNAIRLLMESNLG